MIFTSQRKVYNTGTSNNIISDMFAGNKWFCYVLEDILRADGIKVPGETCIAAGEYWMMLTWSTRFKRMMPLIYNTDDFKVVGKGKSFSGIRFHGGETEAHTEGCLLGGFNVNAEHTRISNSATNLMVKMLTACGGKAKLIIEDRPFYEGGLDNKMAA